MKCPGNFGAGAAVLKVNIISDYIISGAKVPGATGHREPNASDTQMEV